MRFIPNDAGIHPRDWTRKAGPPDAMETASHVGCEARKAIVVVLCRNKNAEKYYYGPACYPNSDKQRLRTTGIHRLRAGFRVELTVRGDSSLTTGPAANYKLEGVSQCTELSV
jgi:hypothetical protein